ncbi:MAG TPA: thiol:disulfide interchange protein DsbA/DsbL [Gammaproteobacteria bacterium]|nr:thiol:disulfide interchange protein DsbA/DsbL [Gammaproteobacteria bacterium]HIL94919.1 thiol:disulfide interchange protein DsbA/DsbL [Pseudomonadales bacterium]
MRLRSMVSVAVILLTSCLVPLGASAETMLYEEGTHYVELQIPIRTRNPDKIEVAEYFSYGCPHCFQFEPMISAWTQALEDDVIFTRTPAVWNKDYQVYAQTYYTAVALKVLDRVHTQIFNAMHKEQRRLNTPQLMAGFFADFGIEPEDFAKTYSSFGVRASLQQADSKGKAYRSGGVPALIVNGKYRIESGMAGSNADMLRIATYLIEQERKAKAGS